MWEIIREFKFNELAPSWASSHVQVPTPFISKNEVVVYFSTRDKLGKSQLLSFHLDLQDITKVTSICEYPLVELGAPGTFDEDGVMVSSVIGIDEELLLYYTGWQRSFKVPYATSVGVLIKERKKNKFVKSSTGPILGRNYFEPYYVNTPYVYQEDGMYKMIYGSGKDWKLISGRYEPTYFLKRCNSLDGVNWIMPGYEFIKPISREESAVRACRYLSAKGKYKIMFSTRKLRNFRGGSGSYSISQIDETYGKQITTYREAVKFINPEHLVEENMLAYPAVFNLGSNFLLFNGSDFGKKSIFLAKEII